MLLNGAVPQEPCYDASVIQGFLDNRAEILSTGETSLTDTESSLPGLEDELTQGVAPAFTAKPNSRVSHVDAFNLDVQLTRGPTQSPALCDGSTLTQGSVSSIGYGVSSGPNLSRGLPTYFPPNLAQQYDPGLTTESGRRSLH